MTAPERLELYKAMTGHVIAILLTAGFFCTVFTALLGFVDMQDATVATFVGTVAGYCIGTLASPLTFYFGRKLDVEERRSVESTTLR